MNDGQDDEIPFHHCRPPGTAMNPLASDPIGETPLRRPHSVRRTMSIEVSWPDGLDGASFYTGLARDAVTLDPDVAPQEIATGRVHARTQEGTLLDLDVEPGLEGVDKVLSKGVGGELRKGFNALAPSDRARGTLRHLLVDDLTGVSIVSRWAPTYWKEASGEPPDPLTKPVMAGRCIAFRPGSTALLPDGRRTGSSNSCPIPPIENAADEGGWHKFSEQEGRFFRRARRIDAWRDGDRMMIESHFQDSASRYDGNGRVGIHEYLVRMETDAAGVIASIEILPGILPFSPCLDAPGKAMALRGTRMAELRRTVPERYKGIEGCTHLNDVFRSLADVPVLLELSDL